MKINKRLSISLLALVAIISISQAQNANTPYSMYGYGIMGDRATSMQRQMGGVGYGMSSGRQINVMNPASYANMDSLTFLFDVGADMSIIWSKEGSAKEHAFGGGLDYITMKFPICKFMAGSFGLVPLSSVGYAFGNEIAHGAVENSGEGGINELYLGVAARFKGFSIGANFSYDFGTINNKVYSDITGNSNRTLFEHIMQVRDWNVLIGAQYSYNIDKFSSLTLGVTYSPKKTLLGKTWVTSQELETGKETLPDTLAYCSMKNKYELPNTFGVGINYTYERSYRLVVEADFGFQQWEKAVFSPLYQKFDDPSKKDIMIFQGMNFNNRMRYSLGGEFIPRLTGNYAQRMTYRLGGYFCNDYLKINGNSVREYGISMGVGLPTPEGKTLINIGFDWKHRSASPQQLIAENYFNITLGINFNEVWFWKRRIQ